MSTETARERMFRKGWLTPDVVNTTVQGVTPWTPPANTTAGFVKPDWFPELEYAMCSGAEIGCLLFGPRGSGKSTAIRQLALSVGINTRSMQCFANMQTDSLIGNYEADSGSTRFVDGEFTRAVRDDCWLFAEELNAAHPGIWSKSNNLLDRTGDPLILPTGEHVARGSNFRFVGLYNDGYTGMREVNPALIDRLVSIHCDYPSKDTEVQWVQLGAPQASATDVERVVDAIRALRGAIPHMDFSPRCMIRLLNMHLATGCSWRKAYDVAVVNLAGGPSTATAQRAAIDEHGKHTVDTW